MSRMERYADMKRRERENVKKRGREGRWGIERERI